MTTNDTIEAIVTLDMTLTDCDCLCADCQGCVPKYFLDGDDVYEQWAVRPGKTDSQKIGVVYRENK